MLTALLLAFGASLGGTWRSFAEFGPGGRDMGLGAPQLAKERQGGAHSFAQWCRLKSLIPGNDSMTVSPAGSVRIPAAALVCW